jgi:hypothetical protein
MGFHRRIINKEATFHNLMVGTLKSFYDSESLIFMDEFSSFVRDLYLQNKTEQEILSIINQKTEDQTNENN